MLTVVSSPDSSISFILSTDNIMFMHTMEILGMHSLLGNWSCILS